MKRAFPAAFVVAMVPGAGGFVSWALFGQPAAGVIVLALALMAILLWSPDPIVAWLDGPDRRRRPRAGQARPDEAAPGNANLPIGEERNPIQANGVPGKDSQAVTA